ncbi:MAG: 2-C-methyl-D-erythritol 4-phosphate cytidylyltransferase [Polaromonas sp.]|nr:2-C-methyl-D-erythritol 4-phosphate cytidylyltransferase [Polaromonas sp.]
MSENVEKSRNSPAFEDADASARVFGLIPCAGQGSRAVLPSSDGVAGLPKQYLPIAGTPMIIHTVEAFRALGPVLAGLWLVISPEDSDFEDVFPGFNAEGEHLLRAGGATRAASVKNGLQALLSTPGAAAANDWVLVHDAARCLITPTQIQALISSCCGDAVGGLLAQPLADTLKSEQLDETGARVSATLDRAGKWLAQTPQMFRIGALLQALKQAEQNGLAVTDESSAMEALGLSPKLVRGSVHNIKITYSEDFALAEAILLSRQS